MKRRAPFQLAHVLDDCPTTSTGPIAVPRAPAPPRAAPPPPIPEPQRVTPPGIEKRIHTRFDKAFLVVIGSELYGDAVAVARNISAGGILVEMNYAPPLGTVVTVHFQYAPGDDLCDEIVARAEVKHHHYLNFTGGNDAASARAIGLRFLDFIDPGEHIAADRLH